MGKEQGKSENENHIEERKTYLLKDIPGDMWDRFAIRARRDKLNIKEAMYLLVSQYADEYIELVRE